MHWCIAVCCQEYGLLYEKEDKTIVIPLFRLLEAILLIILSCYIYLFSQASKTILFKLTSSRPFDEKAVSSSLDKVTLSTRKINKDVKYGVVPGSTVFEGHFLF